MKCKELRSSMHSKNKNNIKSLLLRRKGWRTSSTIWEFLSPPSKNNPIFIISVLPGDIFGLISSLLVYLKLCLGRLRHFNKVHFVFTRDRKCDSAVVGGILIPSSNWQLNAPSVVVPESATDGIKFEKKKQTKSPFLFVYGASSCCLVHSATYLSL